jgi:hypothetical protein
MFGELAQWRTVGDPEADEVVEKYAASNKIKKDPSLLVALPRLIGRWEPDGPTTGIDAPLVRYLKKDYVLPQWVIDNADAVQRAQRRYRRHAAVGQVVLATYSLPIVYLHPEIAVTLMGTGQLIQHVQRRLMETRAFVDMVSQDGALLTRGPSWRWLRKVRLNHAVIRRIDKVSRASKPALPGGAPHPLAVRLQPRNKRLAHGIPIDQLELSYVMLSLSWVMVDGLARLGHPMSDSECDDHIRLWAVVGHMLGIDDALLPGGPIRPPSDAKKMFEAFKKFLIPCRDLPGRPGAMEGHQLVAALLSVLADVQQQAVPAGLKRWYERLPWLDDAAQSLPRTLVRQLCGSPAAATLHVGRAPFIHWCLNQLMLKYVDQRDWNRYLPADRGHRAARESRGR